MTLPRTPQQKRSLKIATVFLIGQVGFLAFLTWSFLGNRTAFHPGFFALFVLVCTVSFLQTCAKVFQAKPHDLLNLTFFLTIVAANLYTLILFYAAVYSAYGIETTSNMPHTPKPDHADCLYFSGITWTTIGYGDLVPLRGYSRLFVVVEAINAYLFLGLFISVLIHMLTNFKQDDKPAQNDDDISKN